MTRLPAFEYLEPDTVEEAVELLAAHPGAAIVAGGTDLFPNMKRRQVRPATVIGLRGVPGMTGVTVEADGGVRIGASTLLVDLVASDDSPLVLAQAAAEVASPQLRNAATVGGNLCVDTRCDYINQSEAWRTASGLCLKDGGDTCWVAPRGKGCVAISSSDLAPAAIAIDARVRLVGPTGSREIAVSDLYRPDGIDRIEMASDEVLVELLVGPPDGLRATYHKLRRRGAIDFPILGVAAAVRTADDGVVTDARIVMGAVAPAPVRVPEAEAALIGHRLEPDVIAQVAALASKPIRPLDNADMGSRYRKWMVSVFVTRALGDLIST